MLGHQLFNVLKYKHDIKVTLRRDCIAYDKYALFDSTNTYFGVDIRCWDRLVDVMADCRPNVVINCVGIVKQRSIAKENIPSIEVNALLPHRLAVLCKAVNARLIHMSTDCVFSGQKGNYHEMDPSDAVDLYGKSKYLGEVNDRHCLTLRTSIIGFELSRKNGLLEWFLAQKGKVNGFTNAIYNGFTTIEMGKIIDMVLIKHPNASGIYHVSSEPISKYGLLQLVRIKLDKNDIDVVADDSFICDRTLDSTRFRCEFGYEPPTWDIMIEELADLSRIASRIIVNK